MNKLLSAAMAGTWFFYFIAFVFFDFKLLDLTIAVSLLGTSAFFLIITFDKEY